MAQELRKGDSTADGAAPRSPGGRKGAGSGRGEPTADGRWIVVDGRRWRASDPGIPEGFRQELVNELMDGRRAVGAAKRRSSSEDEAAARARVHQAKVALGERGRPWWESPTSEARRERLAAAVVSLAAHRGPDRTICPSDAARAVGGDGWRSLMDLTRAVVRDLARAGEVEVTQRSEVLDPDGPWKGPVRIRSLRPGG